MLARLRAAGLPVWLAGGWAEELRGLIPPRPHRDIDLLCRADDFAVLEAFLRHNPEFEEISAKRFSHKRAVLLAGLMIEFVLVQQGAPGFFTRFFGGRFRLDWPAGSFEQDLQVAGQPVPAASIEALRHYRAQHAHIQRAYQQWRAQQEKIMHIVSVNVGEERVIPSKSGKTGIYKLPAAVPVEIGPLGLQGDVIIDTENHGGLDQAVYIYFSEDYAWWSAELGQELAPGTFGENLTVAGLQSAQIWIGDRFETSGVTLEVTYPRIPCVTLAARMGEPTFVKRFRAAERPGVYCRVLRPGPVQAGDALTYQPNPAPALSALQMFRDFYVKHPDA